MTKKVKDQPAMKERPGLVIWNKALPYIMVAPAMIIFAVFVIYPLFYMIYVSFFNWNMISEMKFVGLQNYTKMFSDKTFWQALGNTVIYVLMYVPASMILGTLIAVFIQKSTRLNKILQNIMFLPYIISLVSISFIWMWMMNYDKGLFNYVLSLFGIEAVNWLGGSDTALFSLALVNVWKSLGYYVLIIVAAPQGIPGYLYEAAALDRSNPVTTFFKATLPMLSPTLFYLLLMGIIAAFKTFDSVSIMTSGGPGNATDTIVYELYKQGFVSYRVGYASAMGVALMVIVGGISIFYFAVLQKRVHYQ
ncbi:MAG: sugar ABC transporter permease [Lachnospiraceae bacterium]|nr:sugar ABC transporter permease [Lachnospiraceae bacterium]